MILLIPFAAILIVLCIIVFRLALEEWRNIKLERQMKANRAQTKMIINGKVFDTWLVDFETFNH